MAAEVSVILCVRNGEATVAQQVSALSAQDYPGSWELILVDNGSSDNSTAVALASWSHPSAEVRVIAANERAGLAYARNVGVGASSAAAVAFCDADDIADPGWLSALCRRLDAATVVGGHLEVADLNAPDATFWRGGSPTQAGLPRVHRYLPQAVGANMAARRDAYVGVGGCDEQFTVCSDDVDLSWRIQEAGGALAFADDAVMHYRYRAGLCGAVRQQWRYGVTEGALKRKYPTQMRRDSLGAVVGLWLSLLLRPDRLVRGRRLRGEWLCIASYRAGRIAGACRHRVLWW